MILRLSHACLPISQIQIHEIENVPVIGIENVPEIENVLVYVPVEKLDPFQPQHACVPNRLRFV